MRKPILMTLIYVVGDQKLSDTYFFLSANKRFKGVKQPPKYVSVKGWFDWFT